jgi:hypothetical protein
MKRCLPLVSALVCLIVTGVSGEQKPASPAANKAKEEPFVIFHINTQTPVKLVDDYGVMLTNPGGEKNPSPEFLIAFRKGRTLIKTGDPQVAANALKLIPKGSKVRWYDFCAVPRSYGLPYTVRDNFEAAMKKAGLKLLEDENITCYCEKSMPLPAPQPK